MPALGRRVPIKGYLQESRGKVVVIKPNRQHYRARHTVATALTLATMGAAQFPCAAAAATKDSEASSPESVPARAQSPLTEIIVTARKRDEKAIEVPFSVQVVDSEDLAQLGAVD